MQIELIIKQFLKKKNSSRSLKRLLVDCLKGFYWILEKILGRFGFKLSVDPWRFAKSRAKQIFSNFFRDLLKSWIDLLRIPCGGFEVIDDTDFCEVLYGLLV